MVKPVKCMFCGKVTKVVKKSVKGKINDKMVTLTNSPVYWCQGCNETFFPREVQDMLAYIRENHLESKNVTFNFDDFMKKQGKEKQH